MTSLERTRRAIRLYGLADSKGWPVPIFESRAMNRAIIRTGDNILKARTARHYNRADNKKIVESFRTGE